MKKMLLLAFAAMLGLSSCNKNFKELYSIGNKIANHTDVKTTTEGKYVVIDAQVRDLYPTAEIKRKCPVVTVNFNVSDATLTTKVKCHPDSLKALKGLPVGKFVDILTTK